MTQTFNEDVEVRGSLKIQEATSPNDTLLTLTETGDVEVGADLILTNDGRIQVGDSVSQDLLGMSTPDALIEAHRASANKPKRGIHSLGRISGALSDAVSWMVTELELPGSGVISGIHQALRSRVIHDNSGDSNGAELRAGEFEVINQSGTSVTPVGQATALRAQVTNESNSYLETAVGVEVALSNAGDVDEAYGLKIEDVDQGNSENFAIKTGLGTVHFGDELQLPVFPSAPSDNPPTGFLKVYPKVDGTPKLYAKDDQGNEHVLGGGGSGIGNTLDDLTVNESFTYVEGASNGRVLVSDANGLASWQDAVPTVTKALDAFQQDVLYETTLSTNTSTIDIPSISQDYEHLLIQGELRSTYTTLPYDFMRAILNNDGTDSNYKNTTFYRGSVNGTNLDNNYLPSTSYDRRTIGWITSDGSAANTFSHLLGNLANYANTVRYKRLGFQIDNVYGTTNENQYLCENVGRWISTSAVNRITLSLYNGQFKAGSYIQLIGLKKRTAVTNVEGPVFGTGIAPTPQNALVGEVRMTAAAVAPTGWLVCNGTAISRSTYSDLFTAIGTTYGVGDGSTTFNLPDLRGRAPVGAGQGSGLTNRALGQQIGAENHQLSIGELPSHNHSITTTHWTGGAGTVQTSAGAFASNGTSTTNSVGSNTPHNNIQPSLVMNYIIKY